MENLSWKSFHVGDKCYLLNFNLSGQRYKVLLSDLKDVWLKETSEGELLDVCKELNPLYECESGAVVHKAFHLLSECVSVENKLLSDMLRLEISSDSVELKFRTELDGIPFKFHIKLQHQSPSVFFTEIMLPILTVAKELSMRQDVLCTLLAKKDAEISEYQMQGVRIARRNVETERFIKEDFVSKKHSTGCTLPLHPGLVDVLSLVGYHNANIGPDSSSAEKEEQSTSRLKAPNEISREEGTDSLQFVTQKIVKREESTNVKRKRTKLHL